MAETNVFQVEIITPDRIFFKGEANFLEFNTTSGEIGVYKNHIPMTTVLAPGIITIHDGNGIRNAAIHAGFAEILNDKVILLAEVAEWPDEIDSNRAKEAEVRARRRIEEGSGIDMNRAELALKRALIRQSLIK